MEKAVLMVVLVLLVSGCYAHTQEAPTRSIVPPVTGCDKIAGDACRDIKAYREWSKCYGETKARCEQGGK